MTRTLTAMLAETVAAAPDSVASIDAQDGPLHVTRAELWRRTVALRQELRARGLGRGDCVGVWLPNWTDVMVWQFAVAGLGAHVIGINTRYGITDVAHILEKARPTILAVAHGFLELDLTTTLRAALAEVDISTPAIAVVTGPGAMPAEPTVVSRYDLGGGSWAPAEPDPAAPLDLAALDDAPDDLAVAFTTSGSTGKPKLAAHLGSAVTRHVGNVAAAGGWGPGSVTLVVYPMSGVFGYVSAVTAIGSGGTALMEPLFRPPLVLQHMSELSVTHLASADDINARLMEAWHEHPVPLPAFSHLLIGDFYGTSLQVSAWAEQEIDTRTYGLYGSSELLALTSFWQETDPTPERWRGGGRLVSTDMRVRAVDPVTGEPAPEGEPGEVQFRGYNVVDAYLGDDDGSIWKRTFTDDGWFRSGDLGVVREDGGAFEFCGRMGDAMRLRGFLVEPAEIEMRLAEHPAVARCKIVGVTLGGETAAVAFVEPLPGSAPDPAELREWCAAELAAFKVPQVVHLIDEMPTTAGVNGAKVRTGELRELATRLGSG